ncbi:hypothetical protein CYLTODRAFT_410797 [Cylindrobasidium torrendii FP15055 ss-10]|uniref:Uncharacterized protein n=1 Tax=Cylindrobasidium torrendii FP15055 ss-10 TaxID=1314674 RepID=A0A0D7BCL9_9AGAR|nr:hypothetical protein CYLTODRAFT_410797 [Cylindrobasidium torrendii FP15055 ss-10]
MSDAYIRQNGACAAENLERQIQNDFIHAANVPNAFKYYSGNNECPLENELESLKSEYSAMTSSIIRNTRRNIASRKKTQLKLNILKNAFKSVLSPLRRLPIEVLGYVFEFCVPWVYSKQHWYPLGALAGLPRLATGGTGSSDFVVICGLR